MAVYTGNPGTWRVGVEGPGLETVSSKPNQTQQNKQTPNLTFRTAQGPEARQVCQCEVGVLKGSGRRKDQGQAESICGRTWKEWGWEGGSIHSNVVPSLWMNSRTRTRKGTLSEVPWDQDEGKTWQEWKIKESSWDRSFFLSPSSPSHYFEPVSLYSLFRFLFICCCFTHKVSCTLGWPQTPRVAEDVLELIMILLLPTPESWDYRHGPPCWAKCLF